MDELVVKQSAGTIEFDFDEIRTEVAKIAGNYEGLVVTEGEIKGAKSDLATLRKMKKEIDDRRKEVKAVFIKPYEDFEKKVKEIQAIIDKPIAEIDDQLKAFEAKRVEEKQAHIQELYEQHIGEYTDILPISAVRKPQWDNATYKDADIIYDISEKVQHIKSDMAVIDSLRSEIPEELKALYISSGYQLAAVVKRNSDYEEVKRLAEQKVAKEDLKAEPKAEEIPFATPDKFSFTVFSEEDSGKVIEFMEFCEIKYERR